MLCVRDAIACVIVGIATIQKMVDSYSTGLKHNRCVRTNTPLQFSSTWQKKLAPYICPLTDFSRGERNPC
jgi:hypothetical protein